MVIVVQAIVRFKFTSIMNYIKLIINFKKLPPYSILVITNLYININHLQFCISKNNSIIPNS